MTEKNKIWIIIGASLLVVVLLYFFFQGLYGSSETENHVNWNPTYRKSSEGPYGTKAIHQLLDSYHEDDKVYDLQGSIEEGLPSSTNGDPSTYVFIGREMYTNYNDIEALLNFVMDGNNAFIAVEQIPESLKDYLSFYSSSDLIHHQDSTVKLNFNDESILKNPYELKFKKNNKTAEFWWEHFPEEMFVEDEEFYYLGYHDEGKVNFVEIPYGDGHFYIHSIPLAFTNISVLDDHGKVYAESVFSHFGEGDIYWDERSKLPFKWEYGESDEETPLKYILSNTSLKWGYFLILFTLLTYVLFRSKRKQRVIPLLESDENNSHEFVETLSKLYLQQNRHSRLIHHKKIIFLNFIRDKYYLHTHNLDDQFVKQLSKKSQIEERRIMNILKLLQMENSNFDVSDETLINLHEKIEYFYKNCR